MNRNKICHQCKTEYLPHIEKCVDCGTVLLFPEELGRAEEEKKRLKETSVEDTVTVREGDLKWLSELREVLIDSGIPCAIQSDAGCKKGCCGDKCRLVVSPADLETARERIEEYFMELNPELRASNELIKEGKCPACGSPVGKEARECPDCGLPLLIVIEEEEEE
jgi:peptidyl-tRNA hydrolase